MALDIFRFAHMVLIYMCRSILVDLCRACSFFLLVSHFHKLPGTDRRTEKPRYWEACASKNINLNHEIYLDFWLKDFWGQTFFWTKLLLTQVLFGQNKFWTENFWKLKSFLDPKFVYQIFLNTIFFNLDFLTEIF